MQQQKVQEGVHVGSGKLILHDDAYETTIVRSTHKNRMPDASTPSQTLKGGLQHHMQSNCANTNTLASAAELPRSLFEIDSSEPKLGRLGLTAWHSTASSAHYTMRANFR